MTTSQRAAAAAAVLFVALHLSFLPRSLEDLDSINFALSLRDFDVARHQPHPPGYPVYVLVAKLASAFAGSEAAALAVLSVLAGGLAIFALVALFRTLAGEAPHPDVRAHAATLLVVTTPLFWFTAARPLSDMPGLAAALGAQAALLRAGSARALAIAAGAAGLSAGLRSQVVWLTVPLLLLVVVRRRADRRSAAAAATLAYAAGVLLWAVPLVALNGGPAAYLHALVDQGAEDFSGVAMVWTTPTPRLLVSALQNTLLAPWAAVPLALVVLTWAAVGFLASWFSRTGRTEALTLLAAFAPYVIFHLVFQETATTRYALPVAVPIGYLAIRGAAVLSGTAPARLAVGLAVVNAFLATQSLFWYSQFEAPAFRMLADMRTGATAGPDQPEGAVLAMHRRAAFDLRRPMLWAAGSVPPFAERLASPPKHEWLEVVKYWNRGGRAPVWFIGDPLRSDLVLLQPGRPTRYVWPFNLQALLGGVRPNELDWYRIDPPPWYAGEGWALTPETAGVAGEDGRGPGRSPIAAWIRRSNTRSTVMVGGRNLGTSGAGLRVSIDGTIADEGQIEPGFFLRFVDVPAGRLSGRGDYAQLTIAAGSDRIAIEQFDAQPAHAVVFGYGDGWHEHEYNPATGETWRWASEKASLRIRAPREPLTLQLRGEIDASSRSEVTVKIGDRVLRQVEVGATFEITATVPADLVASPELVLTIESSEWYVPAERSWRPSADRRRLALKIVECRVLVP